MMSYFERIIDITLASGSLSIRPSVTPDSIPESLAEAKSIPVSRLRKYAQLQKSIKGQNIIPMMTNVAKSASKLGLSREGSKGIETHSEPEKRQETNSDVLQEVLGQKSLDSLDNTSSSISDVSLTKQPAIQPVHMVEEQEEGSTKQARKNPPKNKSGAGSTPLTEIHTYQNTETTEPADNNNKPITSEEYLESAVGKETPKIPLVDAQTPELLRALEPWKHHEPFSIPDLKMRSDNQKKKYPSFAPTARTNNKIKSTAAPLSSHEETVVTINIGRIEVKAEPLAEPSRRPRPKFSPALSLADYLKQRSEGKIG